MSQFSHLCKAQESAAKKWSGQHSIRVAQAGVVRSLNHLGDMNRLWTGVDAADLHKHIAHL
eukprot:1397602-Alexandrium_andersonii.AAC.1